MCFSDLYIIGNGILVVVPKVVDSILRKQSVIMNTVESLRVRGIQVVFNACCTACSSGIPTWLVTECLYS